MKAWQPSLQPAEPEQIVAMLTACLALVRPVGMQESETRDWLKVAARAVAHLPLDILSDACAKVQTTCTHHGQIVPKIIAETAERLENRRIASKAFAEPPPALPSPYMPRRLTQAEVDEIVSRRDRAMSVALDNGSIVHGPDGTFVPGR